MVVFNPPRSLACFLVGIIWFATSVLGGKKNPPPPPVVCRATYDGYNLNCLGATCGGQGTARPEMTLTPGNHWECYRTWPSGKYIATVPIACRSCLCATRTTTGVPCKGPACDQGTRTDTIGGYDKACSITTALTVVRCTPIPTTPANALTSGNAVSESFPDNNGFMVLTVTGCGGVARSSGCNIEGKCTCRSNAFAYAYKWRCITDIPPGVSLFAPEISKLPAGRLSVDWVADDPFRARLKVMFYTYVFQNYHSVTLVSEGTPVPPSYMWPTLTMWYKVVRTDTNFELFIDTPPPITCSNKTPTSYWYQCTITDWEVPNMFSRLNPQVPQPAKIPVSFYIGASSPANVYSWTLIGTFIYVPPDPYPWAVTALNKTTATADYLDSRRVVGAADPRLSLIASSQTQPLKITVDRNTAQLVFRAVCVPQTVNGASPADDFLGSNDNPLVLTVNMTGFQTPMLNMTFGQLPEVNEASCVIAGTAVNNKGLDPSNVYGGTTEAPEYVIGIIRSLPVVLASPKDSDVLLTSDAFGPSAATRYYWMPKTSLYTSWTGTFRANAKVMAVMQSELNTFTSSGNPISGVVQTNVEVLLTINTINANIWKDYAAQYTGLGAGGAPATLPKLRACITSLGNSFINGSVPCAMPAKVFPGTTESYLDTTPGTLAALAECELAGTLYDCVDCFRCIVQKRLTAYDAAANFVKSTTYGVIYDSTPPIIRSMFAPDKIVHKGVYWYGNLIDLVARVDLAEPEASLLSMPLDISVDGYRYVQGVQVPNFYQSFPQLSRLDKPNGRVDAVATGWSGFSLQAQTYNIELTLRSPSGQSAFQSFQVRPDTTPPSVGGVTPNHLVYNMAVHSPLEVTLRGLQDPESSVMEIYTLTQLKDNSHCGKGNFAYPFNPRHNWTLVATNKTADGTVLPIQYIPAQLSPNITNDTTGYLYAGFAVMNFAMTPGGAVARSVTIACSWPIILDNGVPSVYVKSFEVENLLQFDATGGTWTVRRVAYVLWEALHIGGAQFYNLTLQNENVEIAHWTKLTRKTTTFIFNQTFPIPPAENFTVSLSASTFGGTIFGPFNVSIVVENAAPVFSTCATTSLSYPSGFTDAALVQINWRRCVSPVHDVDHWVVWVLPTQMLIDDNLQNTTLARNITDLSIPIELTDQKLYKVCIGAYASSGNGTYSFCTQNTIVDTTPPVASGTIRNLHPTYMVPIEVSANTTSMFITWDPWVDKESGVSNYTLRVNCSGSNITDWITVPSSRNSYRLQLSPGGNDISSLSTLPLGRCVFAMFATNYVGLISRTVLSPSLLVSSSVPTSVNTYLSILNGVSAVTSSNSWRFFQLLPNARVHFTWGSVVEYNYGRTVSFLITLRNALVPSDISYFPFGGVMDGTVPLPQTEGMYNVTLSVLVNNEVAVNVTSRDTIVINRGGPVDLPELTEENNFCEISLNRINTGDVLQDIFEDSVNTTYLNAFWPAIVDDYGILESIRFAFRQKSRPDLTSSWDDAILETNATEFKGNVLWMYGVPEVLWSQEMECLLDAIDVNGNVTRLVMPGYLSITPWFAATVVDLSNYAMIGKPASATDYLLYEDIAVTPNSTYTVGFAGFPDLVFQGTVVATITYSVGDQNSPGAPAVFDNILPATRLPVSAVSTTSMVIEENTIPLRKFNIPNFSIPINTLVHACVNVSVIATGNYTFACTDGIVYNPYPPLDGIVDVASTNGFIVTASSIEVSWNGFYVKDWIEPGDDGIAYYTLGVGSYIGWDDVVSTMVIPKTQRKAVSYASLIAGDALYVTVRGYSYAGLAATTYSEALMVDYTAPKSVRGIIDAKAVPTDQDGFYDIVIEFGKFEDNESGLTSVQWVLESEYGLEDVVSLRKTNSPTYIKQAKVELSSAVTYVARIIATNAAGLKQQLVALITADVDLRLLYVTDLRSGGTWTAFSASEKSYTFAWNFTGEASYLEAAVGSASRMSDVMPWTYIDAEARNFTLDLSAFPLTDGALLHATVHAFDAAGKFADSMSSSGIVIDSTPPQIGRVVQGITPFVHHPWTKYPDLVQASWTGFFDADSDLVSIKVCVDNSPSTNPTTSCSNLDWTNAAKLNSTHAVVVDLVLEHWLQPATSYFVKVMATNGAGLISVGVSPAFAVDLEEPIGTSINVGFPSLEANSSTVDGGYFDRTVVQVHWHFQAAPASGISHFLVGIYDVASSTPMTTPAKVPSSVTSWTFSTAAKTLILEFNEGVSYYAVVRGVSGSGMIGDVKSSEFMVMSTRPLVNQPSLRFENFMEPGANSTADVNSPYYAIPIGFNVTGPNDSANATVDVIVYNVGGTTTTSMGPIKYLVHLGSYKYGRNMVNYTLNQTCDSPCSVSFRVPSVNNSMYWASLVSVDAAGLQSDIETVGNFWNGNETPYATNNGSLWVVDGMEPLVIDFNATSPDSITFTGSGLPGFETPTPQDDCDFTYPDGTVLQGPSSLVVVDGIARLTCTPPTLAATAVAALPAEAYVEITIEAGLTLRVPHKRGAGAETIWDPEFVAKVGLSVYENSYRSSPWTWLVNWSNTSADDIAYFTVIGFGTAMITVPGFQTHALFTIALTSAQEMEAKPGNFSWVVCAFPFVNATQSTCFPSELVQVDLMMASVNPEISTGYEDQIPTAVRVQSSSIDSFDYESIQYQSSTTSISLNWTNSFVFASPSNKTVARYDLSIGHAPYERDQDMQLHIVDGQVSTANIPANLVIGIPYFATLVVWDAAGLPSMHVSFPITADESPPASGRVYAGKTPYVMGKRYQNDTSHLFSYWRGFSEPQSVIKGYSYYLCTAANATSCFAGPQWNGMQTRVNATGLNLVQGQTYFVGVEAHNAVGNISDLAFSPGVVIDLTPPSLVDILFGDGGPVANAANTSYSLTWRFSDDESPIVNYHIQMGTIDGGPQYYPWTSISTRNSLPLAGFRLIHNSTVFATVVATNAAGWTTAAKASVRVDLTPPLITGAVQVLDGSGYHQESGMVTVEADWAGVFADPESEIVDYHVAFGRANNPDFYLAGSSLGVLTTCSRSMTVPDGDSLIVTVTATNAAGLSTIARSSPVLFSTNVPSSFTVRLLDSGLNLLLADNNTSLHHVDPSMDVLVRLVGLQDVESGLSSLRVRLLQDSAPVFDWVDMPVQEIIRLSTPELAAGNSTFQVAVQAVNNVNLTSEALSDNFVVIV